MTATATFLVLGACVWSAAAILPLHSHAPASDGHYPWREAWYDQQLDHFSFSTAPRTWKQRYLISDKYWQQRTAQSGPGSVFFYTGACPAASGLAGAPASPSPRRSRAPAGNEGPIDLFAENTGAWAAVWRCEPRPWVTPFASALRRPDVVAGAQVRRAHHLRRAPLLRQVHAVRCQELRAGPHRLPVLRAGPGRLRRPPPRRSPRLQRDQRRSYRLRRLLRRHARLLVPHQVP